MINEPIRVPVVYTRAGDTIDFPSYTFYDGDNVPIDMSSWNFTAIWKHTESTTEPISLTVDSSQKDLGIIGISISSGSSVNIKTHGFWRLIATHGVSGAVKTIIIGKTETVSD